MGTTKAEIIAAVQERTKLNKRQSAEIVETLFEAIRESLTRGEMVKLARFGVFSVRTKRSRIGRNPKTGDATEISARKVVTFKASQILKDRVAGGKT